MLRSRLAGTLVAAVLATAGCSRAAETPVERPERIILVSLDTVRADIVASSLGSETGPMPQLRDIAREGVVFRQFYAASNHTLPSHMTMLTGLDPEAHGVVREDARLGRGVTTLAEALGAAGYSAHAFHEGGFVSGRFGFAQGFAQYRELPLGAVPSRALPAIHGWIRDQGDRSYFLFLHTYVAHAPYGGLAGYRDRNPDRGLPTDAEIEALRERFPMTEAGRSAAIRELPARTRALCTLVNQLATAGQLLGCGGDVLPADFPETPHYGVDLEAIVTSYAVRVTSADELLGSIRRLLVEGGLWDDTLLIVTSDHGEAFFEHGLYQHAYVPFDEVLHVPFVVSYPRLLRGAAHRIVSGPAWHADLVPTVLGLAGAAPPAGLHGLDLGPALRGERGIPSDRLVFPLVMGPPYSEGLPPRRVAIGPRLKAIEGHPEFGDPHGLLFDRSIDPGERYNLRSTRPQDFALLSARARAHAAGLSRRPPEHQSTRQPLDLEAPVTDVVLLPEEEERLRILGFGRPQASADGNGRPPR